MAITLQFSTVPYPGLRPFRYEESDIFFGRERQTDQLLARLEVNRFLAITGPSGCGKSSLIKAGMIPALQAGFMALVGSRWRICQLRPGAQPFGRLARALASPDILGAERTGEGAVDLIQATLRRGPLGLIEVVRSAEALRGATLLIVVDQFEEILRYRERTAADEGDAFVSLLLASVSQTEVPIYVVVTMRSDYLGDCAMFHGLPEAVSNSQYLTPRLTREELALAICGPTRVFGGQVEPKLVNQLLNDSGTDPDQLPLLQHALARLWRRCSAGSDKPLLTVEDYKAIGGLAAALSRHGQEILAELTPAQQRIAEIMFRRLCGTADGRRDVRTLARIREVAGVAAADPADVMVVVEAFARPDCCFLTPPEGPLREDTILDVSHESLIRQWDRLADWAAAEAKSAEIYLRLRDWAQRWKEGNADLWRGPDLASALAWRMRETPSEEWAARYGDSQQFQVAMDFLDSSDQTQRAAAAAQGARRRRELRRARRVALALGLGFAGLATVILAYLAAYVWDHSSYYKDTVNVRGVPQGIGASLSAGERAHHSVSYEITTRGWLGPVIHMQLVNAQGKPRTLAGTLEALSSPGNAAAHQVSRWEYAYDAKNQLVNEVLLDRTGKRIQSTLYPPPEPSDIAPDKVRGRDAYTIGQEGSLSPEKGSCAVFSRSEYSPQGYTTKVHYLDQDGKSTPGKDGAYSKEREYDSLGHIVRRISLWKDGRPMNDDDGNAEARSLYDKAGNEIAEEKFDAAGQPIEAKKLGWQRFTCAYDDRGNCVKPAVWNADGSRIYTATFNGIRQAVCHSKEILYDDRGNMAGMVCLMPDGQQPKSGIAVAKTAYDDDDRPVEDTYFDWTGRPVLGPMGGFHADLVHDSDGNITEVVFFDMDRKPMLGLSGFHKKISRFENGHDVRSEYRDQNGKLVVAEGGYAAIERKFDTHGNEVRTAYIGIDGRPITHRDAGYAIKTTSFDACGRETESGFFDENERPVQSRNGYVHVRKSYDDANNVVEEVYLDEKRQASSSVDGYASVIREFDRNRNVTNERYFDQQGNALQVKDGFAEHITRYNDHNALVEESFLDANRQLVRNKEGWAKHVRRYDDRNGLVEDTYIGVQGEPVLNEEGYTRATYVNDARGREIEVDYFGIDGKPVPSRHGYAKRTSRRDDSGDVVEESYFGPEGMPILSDGGFAHEVTDLDEFGRVVGWAYFGERNEPVTGTTERYHRVKGIVDERGNRLELSLYGTDDKPLVSMGGWAKRTDRYDARNQVIEESYFGVHGEPVLTDDGYARITLVKDARNRILQKAYFGTDDRPVKSKQGFARSTNSYSAYGDLIEVAYFGAGGERVLSDEGYSRFTKTYDSYGHALETAYFDDSDKPTLNNPLHAARVAFSYDKQRRLTERILYLDGKLTERQRMIDDNPVETSITNNDGTPIDGPDGYSRCQIAREWQCFDRTGRPLAQAAEVVDIAAGSPAQQAQLRKGDLITSVDDGPASAVDTLSKQASEPDGQPVNLVVIRDGSRLSIEVPRGTTGFVTRKRFVLPP